MLFYLLDFRLGDARARIKCAYHFAVALSYRHKQTVKQMKMEQSTCKDTTTIQFILSFAQKYAQRFIFLRKQHNKYVVEASFCIFSFYFVSFFSLFVSIFGEYLYVHIMDSFLSI